ncbi:MAG: ABC transporter ATP-binding protein [Opitutales bacterium]
MAAVELEHVSKLFGAHRAVDRVDLVVPEGSIYGFIGPNGSGKTTSLRMILRIIEQDEGQIRVFGQPTQQTANDHIAYLPEERGVYRKLKVGQQLIYFGKLKGMKTADAKRAAREWLERLGLEEWWGEKTEKLSKGMTQKVQFIASVLARPQLLILDEPFSGLDPVNLEVIRRAVLDLRRAGTTVIFSTHDMHTAEAMCDRIFMIYRGQKVLDGSLAEIRARYGSDTVRLRMGEGVRVDPARLPGVTHTRELGQDWELRFEGDPQGILRAVVELGPVERFEIASPSLHDIFVRIANPTSEDLAALEEAQS